MKFSRAMHRMAAWALLASLAAGPVLAGEQERLPAKRWKLKYQAGSAPFATDQPVNVLVGQEAILLLGGKNREQSIRVAAVTQITYDTARGRYVSRALASSVPESQTGDELMLATFIGLPLAIVTLPFKGTRHFVTIEWTEGRRHRAVVLRMKGKTAKGFIAELEQATSLKARDLDREREEFKREQKLKDKQKEPAKEAPPPGE